MHGEFAAKLQNACRIHVEESFLNYRQANCATCKISRIHGGETGAQVIFQLPAPHLESHLVKLKTFAVCAIAIRVIENCLK